MIQGSVKDGNGKAIAYASILISGTQYGTTTDDIGQFSILLKGFEKTIQVSAVGHETKQIALANDSSHYQIILNETNNLLLGGMVVVRSRKRSKNKKVVAPVVCTQANSILIYPNPISVNSTLTIKWNYPVNDEQLVEIYNISGELVQKENTIVQKYMNTTTIKLTFGNTGNYIVRTTDLKTRKTLTTQLLVN